ncbi:hypothetical protein TTHERM_001144955 (macronuclear) [Tetrahymena thermophila SB210]|uniref:Uncharacterized protein n=1 Tax=Tetrahymena thermophila (strain SB210) TaxID=312017 RepID=W7XF59_TETTS|nr:hypothetical protein TTHERM_001144955 [Tetrahymena thermophila SB210]EWS71409.1 hypothetical protein TTHERM_001144955 [Tetrahymena thermophila SB210]|eukprot:XP_012656061.1 hypothetical protein TTHERM_001144955 [Tetrahymena thermophila SB210]
MQLIISIYLTQSFKFQDVQQMFNSKYKTQRKNHEKYQTIKQALVNLDQNGIQYTTIDSWLKDTNIDIIHIVSHSQLSQIKYVGMINDSNNKIIRMKFLVIVSSSFVSFYNFYFTIQKNYYSCNEALFRKMQNPQNIPKDIPSIMMTKGISNRYKREQKKIGILRIQSRLIHKYFWNLQIPKKNSTAQMTEKLSFQEVNPLCEIPKLELESTFQVALKPIELKEDISDTF